MTEQWHAVPGYEGLYEVSDLGHVRSLDRFITDATGKYNRRRFYRGSIIKPRLPKKPPYLTVNLTRNSCQVTFRVHHLVLLAFVGQRPSWASQIRHLNGNRLDCRLTNLAYGTASENQRDIVRHGRNMNANKTRCDKGHPFTEDNLVKSRRQRICKACKRERDRRYRERVA